MIEGAVLLDDVRAFVRRFVVLTDAQADTIALWSGAHILHVVFPYTPYLAITSAEKRSGKSRLLDILECSSRRSVAHLEHRASPRCSERSSRPAPRSSSTRSTPIFGPKAPQEELGTLLNAGFRQGRKAPHGRFRGRPNYRVRCLLPEGAGRNRHLPDTVADRSISIRLRRTQPRHGACRTFRLRDEAAGASLRDRLVDWLELNLELPRRAQPT